jgi:hypothetical protein
MYEPSPQLIEQTKHIQEEAKIENKSNVSDVT